MRAHYAAEHPAGYRVLSASAGVHLGPRFVRKAGGRAVIYLRQQLCEYVENRLHLPTRNRALLSDQRLVEELELKRAG